MGAQGVLSDSLEEMSIDCAGKRKLYRQPPVYWQGVGCKVAVIHAEQLPIGPNIQRETIDGITIVQCKLNGDCSKATLLVSIPGDSFQQRQGLSWLTKYTRRIRYLLAQATSYRKHVPTLTFEKVDVAQEAALLIKLYMQRQRHQEKLKQQKPREPSDDLALMETIE